MSPMNQVVEHLRQAALRQDGSGMTDAELLGCFVERRDEAAFAALVQRHGPMVLGVCRRVLQNLHDAEDAFQATFFVLVRKAASIAPRAQVGNWLYGVAYRTALKAKSGFQKQRGKEMQVTDMPAHEPTDDATWHDLQPLLDRELHRLPDKYRVAVVLCDVEGKTRKEAAHQLGWTEGTLSWRLASARTMLAKRLTRRGLALSTATLALVLSQQASACVPTPLAVSTIQAASLLAAGQAASAGVISAHVAALTEGVLQTMWWTQIKCAVAVCLAFALVGTGVGIVSYRTLAVAPEQSRQAASPRAPELAPEQRPPDDSFAADPREPDLLAQNEREREGRKAAPAFQGRVSAISDDGKVITIETARRGEEPSKTELKLTDQTKVEFTGALKEVLKKLKVGDGVSVWLQDGSKDNVAAIQAFRAPDLAGKITAISGDGKTLTLEVQSRNRGEDMSKVEVKITDQTKIEFTRDDEEKKFKQDYIASVWLQEGSKETAAAVQTSRPRADASGQITAISDDGKVISLETVGRNREPIKHQIKLADATKIEFIDSPENPADKKLKLGFSVTVWLQKGSADTAALVLADARRRAPDVQGTITAVSKDGKVVTLEVPSRNRGEEGTKTEVKLTDKTTIEFKGTDKEEEKKLTVGYAARVWLQEGSKDTAAVLQASKPAERGR